ncbi:MULTISPECIES: replicative DNA helicase [unclassified Streptomyces]|uniref:replicative DNA helicase n=1 Tax=unclassified Streptomyces TaxID=2593676 RepID=UPI00081EE059|nr:MULTISPECIES: replicative DNA helicase [unclassified Streptomyces]MYZ34407.1 replicative DNA helicase [Streptomyces sp. SID4917]SCF67167.1 replicative DNA helicase [Streptomyces sp. MnatMP-M17]
MADDESAFSASPHDLAAEKAVLRAMLRAPEAIADIVSVLTEHDFYRPAHSLIYTAALAVYSREETPDPLTVGTELDKQDELARAGGNVYLHTLASDPAPATAWTAAAERVQALAVLRRTREAAAHIENLVADADPGKLDSLIDAAQSEIHAATLRDRTRIPPDHAIADIMEGVLDEIEALGSRTGGGPTGVPTGFTDLDSLTGGFQPGQLIVVAGRPAMGTSTLTLDFLRSAAIKHNLPSVLFSLESRRIEVSMRLLAAESRVALHHMRSGTMTDEDWTRLARRMPEVTKAPLFVQDAQYTSFSDLRSHCRRMHARHGLRMVALDDLQHLAYGTRRLSSRYEEISEIARCLKHLAMELEIPIVAVSTLNRGPEQRVDKRPMVADLRDSGAIEDNADIVILLHRGDAYEKDSPRAGEADLIVAKHRYGPTATITTAFQGHYGRFVDMAQT